MLKNFTRPIFPFLLTLLLISCKKDTGNGANSGGTAHYAFEGAPSGCSVPVVAGIYNVGVAMTSANTITLNVNVSVKGTYGISTTAANGIIFSGSGEFYNTGTQPVVLTANGTPERSGSFPFVPNTNNTCNFSISFNAGGSLAVFTYTGAPGNCTAPAINGTYSSGISLGAGNYVDLLVDVTTTGAYTISTNSTNGFSFSGSGTFITAGPNQTVRLIGNGTPTSAIPTNFTPTNGCRFTVNVTPPLPAATFIYDMRGGANSANCSTLGFSGTFKAGIALDASSWIEVGIDVITTGTYNVSTNSNNGVTFNATGIFTTTGPQMITFTSSNTPVNGGTFTYIPSGGCAFTINYEGIVGGNANFFTCKVNNVVNDFNDNVIGSLNTTPSAPYGFTIKGNLTGGSDDFSILLSDNNLIAAGNTYNNYTLSNSVKYCYVEYKTGGTTYTVSTTNSNSFSVIITSITATHVEGTFSGTLYENGTGPATKTITAGSFKNNH